jgi:acetolactate synthase I/II/III large subunit
VGCAVYDALECEFRVNGSHFAKRPTVRGRNRRSQKQNLTAQTAGLLCAWLGTREAMSLVTQGMMTRVADTVARYLAAAGVRHAFGIPGGEVLTLIDALEIAGIDFILARHETPAAIMAAGTTAATSAPGLLVTTLGPGLANAVNGIADAVQERAPLLVISGVVERNIRARYTHQILDHAALLRPLVKASFEIESEGTAAVVSRAISLALTPPCGPVHLDLSPAVAAATDHGPALAGPAISMTTHVDPADPAAADVRRLVGTARRPLLLAGLEAARAGAGQVITRIADAYGVPVLTTYKGKGTLDEHHPCALGAAGLSPAADRILLEVVARADLILLAGYDPIEMRLGWLEPFPAATSVIELTTAPADHGMHRVDRRLLGSVESLLAAIFGHAVPRAIWPSGEPQAARERLTALFEPPAAWGPHAVFTQLAEALPVDATLTVDSGAHRILFSQMWRARRPLEVLQSAGFCTMGAALPLAIGAKVSDPGRPVVAVLGDGGLEMCLGELGTLRDQGLPIMVVVLQDRSLALIELKQRQAGLARSGVALGDTDLPAVARAFGGVGVQVTTATALRAALDEALTAPVFTLIACQISADCYVDRF